MVFGLIIPNIMERELFFDLRDPPYWVGSIKFIYFKFGHLIPRVWRTPRGVGRMSVLTMGMFRVLWIGLYLLTFSEWLHGFTDGYLDCCREGVVDGCFSGTGDGVHL
jgi:hypothetical protein